MRYFLADGEATFYMATTGFTFTISHTVGGSSTMTNKSQRSKKRLSMRIPQPKEPARTS